ncbi:MAG TPA: XdhC family protein [Bryobacteraceae bacterium]|nr:XdhC family protein [Bryobacteraceae bacterium]
MFDDFLEKAAQLRSRGEPFAIATVVRFESPISGKPGDKAIIDSGGKIWGWIGGGCAQPTVIKEGLKAIGEAKPRLVRISPSPDPTPPDGVLEYAMTCHSGGAVEIFIEPVLPKPQILILGRSAVAQALAKLGAVAGYAVTVLAPDASRENFPETAVLHNSLDLHRVRLTLRTFVVVSTQGEGDEEALEAALATAAPYIAFVASKTKAEKILEYLRARGVSAERLARVTAPAGLPIGAVSPEEIAVSILAEIVQKGRSQPQPAAAEVPVARSEAKDPVCGMTVAVSGAKHTTEFEGRTIYFCCPHCQRAFEQNPQSYAVEPV